MLTNLLLLLLHSHPQIKVYYIANSLQDKKIIRLTKIENCTLPRNFKLTPTVIKIMADVLNETQVAQFQDAFSAVDTDNDGIIASKQLLQVLRSIGQNPTDTEVQVSRL